MTKRRKYHPFILHVVMMVWEGLTAVDISLKTGRAVQDIKDIMVSDEAKEIYERLESQVIDTFHQSQVVLQAAIPRIMQEKIELALNTNHAPTKNKALQDLLEMGGHGAIKQVEIRKPEGVEEDYADKSEEQIREEILQAIAAERQQTVH